MRRIFKIAVFMALAAFMVSAKTLSAQIHPRRDSAAAYAQNERIKERMAKIREKLNLTNQQSAQIGDILKNSRGKLAEDRNALRNAPEADKAGALLNMKRDKLARDSAIFRTLTPDQKEKLIERMKERHKRMKQYRLHNGFENPRIERRDIPMPSR